MKKAFLIFSALLLGNAIAAQQLSFEPDGTKIKLISEKIEVAVTKPTQKKDASPLLVSALGQVVSLGVNGIAAHMNTRQESFTATYSGRVSEKAFLVNNAVLNMDKITIQRKVTRVGKNTTEVASSIVLAVEQDGSVFRLKTEDVTVNLSKARLKKSGDKGKTIDLDIDVKIDAIWMEYDKEGGAKLESATIGNSSITMRGVKPGTPVTSANYSDWFKMIPKAPDNVKSEQRERGWYSVTVTVKEANPHGVNSKKIADFFKENSETITTLIQGFLPKADEEEEAKKEEVPPPVTNSNGGS